MSDLIMINVSIIIPTLNCEKHIGTALRSILEQKITKLEIIVVDGGSDDETLTTVDSFSNLLNISILKVGKTSIGEARNIGLRRASGKYIAFLDSDDMFLPARLSTAIEYLELHPKIDAIFTNFIHFDPNNSTIWQPIQYPLGFELNQKIFFHSSINLNTLTVRKIFLERKNVEFEKGIRGRYGEDWNFIAKLILMDCKFEFTNEPLAVVTIRKDSHSSIKRQWKMKFSTMITLNMLFDKIGNQISKSRNGLRYWLYKTVLIMGMSRRKRAALKLIKSVSTRCGGQYLALIYLYISVVTYHILGDFLIFFIKNYLSERTLISKPDDEFTLISVYIDRIRLNQ